MRDFCAFLRAIPALAELLEGAEPRAEDLRFYAHLPYVTRQYMGRGWALLGDAAAFLDPYYSPGLDHAAFSVEATARDHQGGPGGRAAGRPHRGAQRHLRALLPPLLPGRLSRQVLLHGRAGSPLGLLPDGHRAVLPLRGHSGLPGAQALLLDAGARGEAGALSAYHFMRSYNRRFKTIALARRRLGAEGRRNHGRRLKPYFALDWAPSPHDAYAGLRMWTVAELDLLRLRALSPFRRPTPPPLPSARLGPAGVEPEKAAAE